MSQATIDEAYDAFAEEVKATLKKTYDQRATLAEIASRGSRWAAVAAESLAAVSVLLYKCLRLIRHLVEENKRLRSESMETKRLNTELARTNFHPVAKERLN